MEAANLPLPRSMRSKTHAGIPSTAAEMGRGSHIVSGDYNLLLGDPDPIFSRTSTFIITASTLVVHCQVSDCLRVHSTLSYFSLAKVLLDEAKSDCWGPLFLMKHLTETPKVKKGTGSLISRTQLAPFLPSVKILGQPYLAEFIQAGD